MVASVRTHAFVQVKSVVIVDNDRQHFKHHGGVDSTRYDRRTVVLPEFHKPDASQADRLRMRLGCMHQDCQQRKAYFGQPAKPPGRRQLWR